MLTVTKKFSFDAAHWLPEYNGKCKNNHGHLFCGEIEVNGWERNVQLATTEKYQSIYNWSIVCDFSILKKFIKEYIVDKLDHTAINDLIEIPTAENIVHWIKEQFTKYSKEKYLVRIRLYETPDSYAEWRRDKV